MAKGSLIGVKRGKVGNMVAYNITNSNNKEKQGWREYQPVVRNPQTDAQMAQRVKMAAVTNLYRDLKSVITRGFENKAYGNESRKEWMKIALGSNFNGPWLVKGDTQGLPIQDVPISIGSITPIRTAYANNGVNILLPDITGYPSQDPMTIGQLSAFFKTAGYQDGDQITIVMGWVPIRLAFAWDIRSFVIDEGDNRDLSEVLGVIFISNTTTIDDTSYVTLRVDGNAHNNDALAVVVSRNGDTMHLRSTAYFAWNPAGPLAAWYSQLAYENAKQSYVSQSAASLDWPVDPREDVEDTETAAMLNSETPAQVTVTNLGADAEYATVYDETNGVTRFIYNCDAHSTKYHNWLTTNKTGAVWTSESPTAAVAANAIRFIGGTDANASDIAFAEWLVAQGYNARALYGVGG